MAPPHRLIIEPTSPVAEPEVLAIVGAASSEPPPSSLPRVALAFLHGPNARRKCRISSRSSTPTCRTVTPLSLPTSASSRDRCSGTDGKEARSTIRTCREARSHEELAQVGVHRLSSLDRFRDLVGARTDQCCGPYRVRTQQTRDHRHRRVRLTSLRKHIPNATASEPCSRPGVRRVAMLAPGQRCAGHLCGRRCGSTRRRVRCHRNSPPIESTRLNHAGEWRGPHPRVSRRHREHIRPRLQRYGHHPLLSPDRRIYRVERCQRVPARHVR